jgi:hypothetical protein
MINNTKDYFAYDLHRQVEPMFDKLRNKHYTKTTFYFYPWNLPDNYYNFMPEKTKIKI